jgi:TPP-dependent pyruvate/acetoin dehydrogenase alpha subunit
VLVIAPTDFTIPYRAYKYAHVKGKDIAQMSLSKFATDEVRRHQMYYLIEFKYTRIKEASHPDELAYLAENFSDVMRQFW